MRDSIKRHRHIAGVIAGLLLTAAFGLTLAAGADFELVAPDGRRILLKDDNTWRYMEDEEKKSEKPAEAMLLRVENKVELATGCRFGFRLINKAPYEIRSMIPEFTAYKTDGVVYDTVFMAFSFLKPGASQYREVRFAGLACSAIGHVKVAGADRCDMQDLGKFSNVKGECLARLRVDESDLVRIAK